MKKYIVLDRHNFTQYGVTTKLWLVRLFILQRREYNRNLIYKIQKDTEDNKFNIKLNDLNLRYLSGFALTNREIDYINYEIDMISSKEKIEYFKNKYRGKSIQKFLKKYEEEAIPQLIEYLAYKCITDPSHVDNILCQKAFFESLKGGK
ncbi:MAG: hypothetical protein SPF22_08315 [Candidatus Onthovivens sp.]|nr:hypothetical protein [Candidatus Onthovivens sp.]